MEAIRTVLCPIDFSPATERQLAFAVDLCRLFGARLGLHHNLDTAPPGAAVGWMWSGAHPGAPTEAGAEERLRRLMAALPELLVGGLCRDRPSSHRTRASPIFASLFPGSS